MHPDSASKIRDAHENGFSYTGIAGKVRYFCCIREFTHWKQNDVPLQRTGPKICFTRCLSARSWKSS